MLGYRCRGCFVDRARRVKDVYFYVKIIVSKEIVPNDFFRQFFQIIFPSNYIFRSAFPKPFSENDYYEAPDQSENRCSQYRLANRVPVDGTAVKLYLVSESPRVVRFLAGCADLPADWLVDGNLFALRCTLFRPGMLCIALNSGG